MNQYVKLFLLITVAIFFTACATNSQRLSMAEDKTPVEKIDLKIKKYVDKLYSQDATERAWAAYNIGKSAKVATNTVPYLIAVLNDDETAVMTRYVGRSFTSGTTTTTADEAVKALAKIGSASVKPLTAALKDKNNVVVLKAIKTLGLIKDNESIKPLVAFLNHKDKRIRLEAANSLSKFKNPWIAEYLLTALKNKDPAIRSSALYALGKIKNPVAVPELLALLNDPEPAIQSQVLYVLSNFRDERIIEPLIAQTKLHDVTYRIGVINALGNIRDYRIIECLLALLKDKDRNIQTAAADSLAQISDVNFGVNLTKWQRWWEHKLKRSQKK